MVTPMSRRAGLVLRGGCRGLTMKGGPADTSRMNLVQRHVFRKLLGALLISFPAQAVDLGATQALGSTRPAGAA